MHIRKGGHHGFEDDDEVDEGPSSEDLDRLDHDTALCPDCGAEIWDAADVCPQCFAYIGEGAARRKPSGQWQRLALMLVLAAGLIIITLMCFMAPAFNNGRLPG